MATITAPNGVVKRCKVCNKDVTHDKRMKDADGRYYCFDCGAAERASKAEKAVLRCPRCKKEVSPKDLVKVGQQYICEPCSLLPEKKKSIVKGDESPAKTKFKIAVGTALLALGAWLIISNLG